MSEIGCRFSPHKYADLKQRLPRIARPVPAQGSTNHRDHLLRITSEQARARCGIAPPAALSITAGKNIHHCGFCGTGDISAKPMDII